METLDAFWNSPTELQLVVTGATAAPTVIDLPTGNSVTLTPARINVVPFGFSIASSRSADAGAWWGVLQTNSEVRARLAVVADGAVRNILVHPPEPLPPPASPPPTKRRRAKTKPQ